MIGKPFCSQLSMAYPFIRFQMFSCATTMRYLIYYSFLLILGQKKTSLDSEVLNIIYTNAVF
jgi:hypothetical protein